MVTIKLSDNAALKYALENGMVDIDTIRKQIEMNERKRILRTHRFAIWQGKDKKWYTYVNDNTKNNGRKLVKRVTRTKLEDYIILLSKPKEGNYYFYDVFKEWLQKKENYGEIKKQTADRYMEDYIVYIKDSEIDAEEMKYITEEMLEDFCKTTIFKKHMSTTAWRNLKILLRGVFKYAKKKKLTDINISNFFDELEISNRVFNNKRKNDDELVFSSFEEQMIKKYILQHVDIVGLGILFVFQTGLRCGELSALKWEDVQGNYILIRRMEESFLKDGKRIYQMRDFPKTQAGFRRVFLTNEAFNVLNEIKKINPDNEYVFYRQNKTVHGYLFTQKLNNLCKRLNITQRSLHKVRMTYATKLLDGNVTDGIVCNQMGHSDISTTRKYYYHNNKTTKEAELMLQNALN